MSPQILSCPPPRGATQIGDRNTSPTEHLSPQQTRERLQSVTINAHRGSRPPHKPARCSLWSRLLQTFNNYPPINPLLSAPVCTLLNLLVMRKMKCPVAIMLLGARMRQMYTELDYNVVPPVPKRALGLCWSASIQSGKRKGSKLGH